MCLFIFFVFFLISVFRLIMSHTLNKIPYIICEEVYGDQAIKYIHLDSRKVNENIIFTNYSSQNVHHVEITPTKSCDNITNYREHENMVCQHDILFFWQHIFCEFCVLNFGFSCHTQNVSFFQKKKSR